MATYYAEGQQYTTSLLGLFIESDTDEPYVFILESMNDILPIFEKDSNWNSKTNHALILYANKENIFEPDKLTYVAWNQLNDTTGESEVHLDENDKMYLMGLLLQYNYRRYSSKD